MISFASIRTRRVCLIPQELTLGQAITVCKLPAHRHELVASELLKHISAKATSPLPRYITDPRLWTLEERIMVLAQYLAQVSPDGPDFAVGSHTVSEFVNFTLDADKDEVSIGSVSGKERLVRPLLGIHGEALEQVCESRAEWMLGAMACQMFAADEAVPDWSQGDLDIQDWVRQKMESLRSLPESEFEELYSAWLSGRDHLRHFVDLSFDDEGAVCVAREKEEGGDFVSARFLALSAISDTAKLLSR